MKPLLTILLMLMCLSGVVGQNASRDYKSSLDFSAWHASFSVSPSGEIWMSDNYDMWHTNGMSSSWEFVPHSRRFAVDFSYVVCPDTNTVLIFGRIFDPSDTNSHYNNYLRSTDGGKSWAFLSMPYRMDRDKIWVVGRAGGQVWLRIDSTMYYSSDKGLHFQEIATIPDRKFNFDMADNGRDGVGKLNWRDSTGISRNSLLITRDNWAHYEKVPTPYDQHPEINWEYFYTYALSGSMLVLEQGGRYFTTSIDDISWQEIQLNIRDIIADRENNEWVIVTRENQLLRSADLRIYDTVNTNGPCYFTKIKHADRQAVYGFSFNADQLSWNRGRIDSLYRISSGKMTSCGLYTEQFPISPSRFHPVSDRNGKIKDVIKANGTKVALDSDHDLVLYDRHNKKWYRHLKTTFPIWDVQVCSGELADDLLLSDGARLYLAKIDTPVVTPFRYERPLDEFLKSPVTSVNVGLKGHSCDGHYEKSVLYTLKDNTFVIEKLSSHLKKDANFSRTFSAKRLHKELKMLNNSYDSQVRVSDFGFTQDDYDSLRRFLFSGISLWQSAYCDSITREHILKVLPQLGDSIWTDIIQSYQSGKCTTVGTLEITFQNAAGKTLVVSCTDDACSYGHFPYMTPFLIQCDGYSFPGTNIPFMRFIGEIRVPSMFGYNFSNFSLLMKAFRYVLWHREEFGV